MRIIARLDIKNNILIKSTLSEGVKKVGDPIIFSKRYYNQGIDEILLINNTGSLYMTNLDPDLVKRIRNNKLVPIGAGGGIKSVDEAKKLIDSGADKVVINSLIHTNRKEVEKLINFLGSASIIGTIELNKLFNNKLYAFYEMNRENSHLNLEQALDLYSNMGIGEVYIFDTNRDGLLCGCNLEIINIVKKYKKYFPILIGGGFNSFEELRNLEKYYDGVVISSALHFKKINLNKKIKNT